MTGVQKVSVSNRYAKFEFELHRNITIVRGDSGPGKTALYSMIADYTSLGDASGIKISCAKKCVALIDINWKIQLQSISDSIVFIDEGNPFGLNVVRFKEPNQEWLRYVVANRTSMQNVIDYDIVIGPVANDQTVRTISDYINGYLTEDLALQLLLPQKLKDQFAFKTETALQSLHFKETVQ